MPEMSAIRLLIADDHPLILDGLVSLVQHRPDMQIVAQTGSGREIASLYAQHRPDIALIDLHLQGMSGLEAIETIRHDFPEACIVVLTAYGREEYILRALRAGVKAFLLKETPAPALIDTLLQVHSGHMCITPEIAAVLAAHMSVQELTAREKEVLALIAQGKSNLEIGSILYITEATVKSHVNSILSKMHVEDRTQAVVTALKRGMVTLTE